MEQQFTLSSSSVKTEKKQSKKETLKNGFCGKCGAPLKKGSLFCSKCGEKLKDKK